MNSYLFSFLLAAALESIVMVVLIESCLYGRSMFFIKILQNITDCLFNLSNAVAKYSQLAVTLKHIYF